MNLKPDILLVGFEPSRGEDTCVLIVGRKPAGQPIDVVNAFQGKEAKELYEKLVATNGRNIVGGGMIKDSLGIVSPSEDLMGKKGGKEV